MSETSLEYNITYGLSEKMRGLILGATVQYVDYFNVESQKLWAELNGMTINAGYTFGLRFERSRRLSDHSLLPHEQSDTTLFTDHNNPERIVGFKAGQTLAISETPLIVGTDFVFSLIFPAELELTVVRWPLTAKRPVLQFDNGKQPDIQ